MDLDGFHRAKKELLDTVHGVGLKTEKTGQAVISKFKAKRRPWARKR